jgi:hypothetical protein
VEGEEKGRGLRRKGQKPAVRKNEGEKEKKKKKKKKECRGATNLQK